MFDNTSKHTDYTLAMHWHKAYAANNYKDDTYPMWACIVWYFKPSKTT